MIRLPMLKRLIKAEGLFPADLETAIAQALRDEQILVDPFVTVTIAEYHSRPISVSGAVKMPLVFQAKAPSRCSKRSPVRRASAKTPARKFWSAAPSLARMAPP